MKRVAARRIRGTRASRPLCCAPRTTHSEPGIPGRLFGEAPREASEALALPGVSDEE